MADRYRYFRIEAHDIVQQLGQGALDLEKGSPPAGLIPQLLRLAHTLKGAARVVGQREIAECAHRLEDQLGPLKQTGAAIARWQIDPVFDLVDEMGRYLKAIDMPVDAAPPAPESGFAAGTAARATPATPLAAPEAPPIAAVRPAMDDLDALLDGVFEAHSRLGLLRPKLAHVERGRQLAGLVVDQLARPHEVDVPRTAGPGGAARARSIAEDLRATFTTLERDFTTSLDQLDRELRQVREAAERLRLVPASAVFLFLERAVRDVARALGKPVVFEARGGDVRVDPAALTLIQGALLHVVRNAAAHGIEDAAERRAAGKDAHGRVTLDVTQRGRLVSFSCTDDGRGIDLHAVRTIAHARGLTAPGGGPLDDQAVLQLLLKGGISTAGTVTGLAGRGIGLDVVREAAERLGGELAARTADGRGTTVDLVIPLSIAAFDTLMIAMADGAVAIPLHSVRAAIRLDRQDLVRTDGHRSIVFNGRAIPVVPLPHALSSSAPAARGPHVSAVVVQGKNGLAAFTADRILGTAPVVMRPLPEWAPALDVVAGVAFDAAGDPRLVLDPDSLVASAHRGHLPPADTAAASRPILVIDDSLTTRMLEQSILESAGYEVELATSAEEGLEKARRAEYALFLVDVEMPGIDGFTFVEQIRADPTLHRVPAILVTSRNAPEDRQRGIAVGAQGYMVKSEFDQGALLERIRTLVMP